MDEITHTLEQAREGDPEALDRLFAAVYQELKRLASRKLAGERSDHTLQPTALVHEAYLRLLGCDRRWERDGYFFASAAEAMRRILVESARRKGRRKRGGDRQRRELDMVDPVTGGDPVDLVALDEALAKLATQDPTRAEVVKLRYFAGLTGEEAAAVLGISRATADRHWSYARAWLYREMTDGGEGS